MIKLIINDSGKTSIMDELYRLKPLFPVQSEFGQIDKIFKILGTPNYEEWSEGYRFMEK